MAVPTVRGSGGGSPRINFLGFCYCRSILESFKNKIGHPCMEEWKSSQCGKIVQSYTYSVRLEVLVLKGVMSLQMITQVSLP